MPQAMIVSGSNYASFGLGRALRLTSDRTNLVGEFIFGRDVVTSTFNSATANSKRATAVGTITYSDHYANPAGVNYFSTNIANAADLTMMTVVAHGASNATEIYFSSPNGIGPNDFYFGNSTGNPLLSVINSAGVQFQATFPNPSATPLTEFRAIAARIGGASAFTMEVDEFKGGSRLQSAATTATGSRVVDGRFICIGSIGGSTTWDSPKNTSAVLIWYRLLTDTELLDAYLECRNVLGRMGIEC